MELVRIIDIQAGRAKTSQSAAPTVYCVVVNWNGWRDTCGCLKSLEEQTYHNLSIIVVDNGSNDDSVARLKAICPRVMIVETKMNLGYAAANNVGIRLALEAGRTTCGY
jgi:GT2 family glycosyltransferase